MVKKESLAYASDASRLVGKPSVVLTPNSVGEVKSLVLQHPALVIRGGGSGFCGGCVPVQGEAVLDVSKLTALGSLDKERKTIEVECGVLLSELQTYLFSFGLTFPIDISSREIATIGGMIATNAYSPRNKDYGRVSHWIQWIEVVTSDGSLQRKGATEISDYCGMEGTTGVIVRACLKLTSLKVQRSASLLEVSSIDEAISIARNMKREPSVSLVEFFDAMTSSWLGLGEGFHVIIEYEDDTGTLKGEAYERVAQALDRVYREALARDYLRVQDPKIVIDRFDRIAQWLDEREIPFAAHLTNGIILCFFNTMQEQAISELLTMVRRMGGQVSGSHGVGFLKKEHLDEGDRKIFANIKQRCDPHKKFNPEKLL